MMTLVLDIYPLVLRHTHQSRSCWLKTIFQWYIWCYSDRSLSSIMFLFTFALSYNRKEGFTFWWWTHNCILYNWYSSGHYICLSPYFHLTLFIFNTHIELFLCTNFTFRNILFKVSSLSFWFKFSKMQSRFNYFLESDPYELFESGRTQWSGCPPRLISALNQREKS